MTDNLYLIVATKTRHRGEVILYSSLIAERGVTTESFVSNTNMVR